MKQIMLKSALLDVTEKVTLLTVFLFFMVRMITDTMHHGSAINYIYLIDQLIIICFLIFRRGARQITNRVFDWLVGFLGTFLPLLIVPIEKTGFISTALVSAIMIFGIFLHLSAKLILRRSFGIIAANRGVKIEGPYRFVRHPMYLGYMTLQVGFLLGGWSLHNFLIIITVWVLHLTRIVAEEKILSQDPDYQAFMSKVRFKLIPGIY